MSRTHVLAATLCMALGAAFVAEALAAGTAAVIATSSRSRNPGYSNMWIGKGFGIFEKDGIDATIYGANGHAESLQLLLTDRVTLSVGVQDTVLKAMAEGRQLPVVAACDYTRGIYNQVIVREDSPIKSFAELSGHKVGVASLAAQQLPFTRFSVASVGGDPDSIEFIAVGGGQQAAIALTSGKVDALASFDVAVAQLRQQGAKVRILENPPAVKKTIAGQVFAFHKPWYEAHKDAAVRLLQGMVKSMILAVENPEAAVRMSFKMYPESVPNGVPFETAVRQGVELLKVRAHLYRKDVGDMHRWCEFSPEAWQSYVDLIGLKGKVDPAKFYTNELVDRINDFDEAAFRKWARSLKVQP
ncbi:MAG TPA: ABC transporter substrate-binding protein [Burkholderiales bacterium]